MFDFDYDLTFAVFFFDGEGRLYARYGSRDAAGPDERQSLAGLRHTMSSVLDMHQAKEKAFAPRTEGPAATIRDIAGAARRCYHCHQVREALDRKLRRDGKWESALAWRYPPPETIGLTLEVDRGNVVKAVAKGSAAAKLGLQPGDVLKRLGDLPLHSQADVQTALDRAPVKGKVALSWARGEKSSEADLDLPEGWRKHDLSWRPSMRNMVPSFRLSGKDLGAEEKKALGLGAKQLAFRTNVQSWARSAGVKETDVILGVDGRKFDGLTAEKFRDACIREYLVGDKVRIDLLRDGKRVSLEAKMR